MNISNSALPQISIRNNNITSKSLEKVKSDLPTIGESQNIKNVPRNISLKLRRLEKLKRRIIIYSTKNEEKDVDIVNMINKSNLDSNKF